MCSAYPLSQEVRRLLDQLRPYLGGGLHLDHDETWGLLHYLGVLGANIEKMEQELAIHRLGDSGRTTRAAFDDLSPDFLKSDDTDNVVRLPVVARPSKAGKP